jgi:hypothetical protein
VHSDGALFEQGVQFYEERGTVRARERIQRVVIVTIDRAPPLISPAYDLGVTEDQLRRIFLGRLTGDKADILPDE